MNATVVVGVFNQTTQEVEEYLLAPGDIGNVPKGLGHYIKEVGVSQCHPRSLCNCSLHARARAAGTAPCMGHCLGALDTAAAACACESVLQLCG